eukprot:6938615-Pyramimonas_sp.AAC.1
MCRGAELSDAVPAGAAELVAEELGCLARVFRVLLGALRAVDWPRPREFHGPRIFPLEIAC